MMARIKNALRPLIRKWNETLDVERIDVPLQGLPSALDGFAIAVIADMHIRTLSPYHASILAAARDARPDCVAIAGDIIDERTVLIDSLTPFFTELAAIAPTVAILGNNDCMAGTIDTLRAMYRRSGVILLENEQRLLPVAGGALQITGLMDPRAQACGIAPARDHVQQEEASYSPLPDAIRPKKETEDTIWPSILLAHQPQLVAEYAPLKPSLIISGHAHGGQFRLPGIGGLYAPGQGVFPRLTSGLYHFGDTQLIVSRGLGNHEFPFRLNNHPHIPVVVLRQA